jgi:hypothetical protein
MVFAIFDSCGLIYMGIAFRSATVNGIHVVDVLGKFRKNLLLKRPEMMSFHSVFRIRIRIRMDPH